MADPGWKPNPGHCPEEAAGKRVFVVLYRDRETMEQPKYDDQWNPMSKPGWAADGKDGCRWGLSRPRHPFNIAFWRVVGQ